MASPAEIESPSDSALAIELRGVTKVYSEGASRRTVFEGVDLRVRRGEFVVVIGRSGSGKSTLLNLISGIDLATAGSVVVLGRELERASEEERTLLRRAHIGFVFQFFNLLPMLSAKENILLPLTIAGEKPEDGWLEQIVKDVGLEDRLSHRPSELSGGQQQRVAIARALISKPTVLFADEPTGNLDSATSGEILELLRRSVDDYGQTIVMVTHDSRAAAVAHRVLFLADGSIVRELGECDPHTIHNVMEELAAA